jgi:hypothetical protein
LGKVKDPIVIDSLLSKDDYSKLMGLFGNPKRFEFQQGLSRYVVANNSIPELGAFAEYLVPVARKVFQSETLLPTYTLFSHYEGSDPAPSLYRHKDDNACTYTLDMCLYQTEPWDLYVDGKAYTLTPNQALAYYGNDQEHWREDFPNPGQQHVAMIFFHFAEPDHWFFTKGPSYLSVIRKEISEEHWENNIRILVTD